MTEGCGSAKHAALEARLDALERVVEERAARNKERIDASREYMTAALDAAERAVTKAEIATDKRFESVNEFRAALSDQASLMITRNEFTAQQGMLLDKLDIQNKTMSSLQLTISNLQQHAAGRTEGLGLVGQLTLGIVAFVSMGTAILAAIAHFLK